MRSRDADEEHRGATPLELLFDLCFVVAVALAADRLHHGLAEDHVAQAVPAYLMVFFAIWWAWMNFTWFASAYDTDDVAYRLTTMVQIGGALILAAGVPRAFDERDFGVVTLGYVVMRLAMVTQWLRAARSDPDGRRSAHRFAIGITLVQLGWVLRLLLPEGWGLVGFGVLVLAELAVPLWAERAGATSWHPHHIAERYGLFTLIVLGETVLAATITIQSALDAGHGDAELLTIAGGGLVIVFGMWWLYFDRPAERLLSTTDRSSFAWGYGHLLVFGSAAAVGAGLQVMTDVHQHVAHLGELAAGWTVAVPVAVYVLMVWLLQVRPSRAEHGTALVAAYPVTVLLLLAAPLTHATVPVCALLLAALVALDLVISHRRTHVASGR